LKAKCNWCGTNLELSRVQEWKRRKRGQKTFFCNKSHAMFWKRSHPGSREKIEEGSRKGIKRAQVAAEKAKVERGDWLNAPEVQERAMESARRAGVKPLVRGGNGKSLPVPQEALIKALGPEWIPEYPVRTGKKPGSGYPTNYKVDIAHWQLKVAVEVDGKSHRSHSRQDQDRKKEDLLIELGWSVLRFSNQQVMEHLEACVHEVWSTISR
jgi:hypothetical protein